MLYDPSSCKHSPWAFGPTGAKQELWKHRRIRSNRKTQSAKPREVWCSHMSMSSRWALWGFLLLSGVLRLRLPLLCVIVSASSEKSCFHKTYKFICHESFSSVSAKYQPQMSHKISASVLCLLHSSRSGVNRINMWDCHAQILREKSRLVGIQIKMFESPWINSIDD